MDRLDIDFRSPAVIADPWPAFARLRDDDPAHWNAGLGGWCLTRYADVTAAFKDERFSSDRIRPFVRSQRRAPPEVVQPLGDVLGLWAVFNDPPAHTRLRKLLARGFTPKAIAALRTRVAAIVDELLDTLPRTGTVDFIARFAYPLPALVIAEILGVPRADIAQLKAWSDDVAAFVLVARTHPTKYDVAAASLRAMCAYFAALVERRRAAPAGRVIDDLIAAHEDDDALSVDELVASCVLLLFAGHETTTHFLANGLWALVRHPDQLARLRATADAPGALAQALDEMLRWDGPSIMQLRVLAADVALHGRTLRTGERVFLFNAAANRDPRAFHDADRFDIGRDDAQRQIAFGHGIHFCLGAHLAKLEGAVAFPRLLERLEHVAAAFDTPAWSDSLVIRGMREMPVAIRCREAAA